MNVLDHTVTKIVTPAHRRYLVGYLIWQVIVEKGKKRKYFLSSSPLIFAMAALLSLFSCKSQQSETTSNVDYSSYFDRQSHLTDSLFSIISKEQNKTTEALSKLEIENTTTYYTLPDSAGKQYPVYVSTTTANKDEKVNESMFTELSAEMSRMREMIDSLTNEVNAAMNQKEEVTELSWWDLHKWEIFIFAVLAIALMVIIIYTRRMKKS